MKIYLQLASFFIVLHTVTLTKLIFLGWKEYKEKFNKTYGSEEEDNNRMKIFMDRQFMIAKHNDKYEKGEVTYRMDVNKFSDLTDAEFIGNYTGLRISGPPYNSLGAHIATFSDNLVVPDEVNWVKRGAVTPVKDQGKCRSSYAFSAVGAMEGQHFRKSKILISLSEQNVVDCGNREGNEGCSGGHMNYGFLYVADNKGIDTEASYPYEAQMGECRFKTENVGATFSGFKELRSGDENALKKAVAIIGPISVAVDPTNFMSYKSGIFTQSKGSKIKLNHSMLVVGYGTDNKTQQQYWLVKNSWGADWGENGYIRIARNANNTCGIALYSSFPVTDLKV